MYFLGCFKAAFVDMKFDISCNLERLAEKNVCSAALLDSEVVYGRAEVHNTFIDGSTWKWRFNQ